ncbi:hypothetical protein BBJ28_00024092 [Nothophytophthora sp. Chile5]|nr:hypothetical protein BBJ28_00024092 [Nothophytophthora sp. Chile5]
MMTPRSTGSFGSEALLSPADVHDISEEGSDMTRDIFFAVLKGSKDGLTRTKSLPDVSEILYEDVGTSWCSRACGGGGVAEGKASDIAQPGGFRRDHVIAKMPAYDAVLPSYVQESFLESIRPNSLLQSTYGDFIIDNLRLGENYSDDEASTPLLSGLNKLHKEMNVAPPRGASVGKTVFTIFKSFIGSGILFLPKAFQNGGMLFSIVGLCVSATLSAFCMLRLTECSNVILRLRSHRSVSYGLVGAQAFGNVGRVAVNVSLVLSQIGFCCSYLIFVEKNIGEVMLHAFKFQKSMVTSSWTLILLQIPLYTPLTWVRHIEYFAITNLFADVLILFGLLYIIAYSLQTLESAPAGSSTWEYFNSENWAMFLGVAVYCFEGIGLVLPTYDAMDDQLKHKFPTIVASTIMFLVVFFSLFAGAVYAAFGQSTQSVVTLNLPNASVSSGTMIVQLTYSLALVLTYPLMLYPVVNTLESYFFSRKRVKGFWRWKKNGFRFALVCLTAAIAYFGKEEVSDSLCGIVAARVHCQLISFSVAVCECVHLQLDNFVALIGGFCSVPLAFIYPCLFHSR